MISVRCHFAAGIALATVPSFVFADETMCVALVPGGLHSYFAAWEQAAVDAAAEFELGAADYKVPQKWELGLQNQMFESLVTQG